MVAMLLLHGGGVSISNVFPLIRGKSLWFKEKDGHLN